MADNTFRDGIMSALDGKQTKRSTTAPKHSVNDVARERIVSINMARFKRWLMEEGVVPEWATDTTTEVIPEVKTTATGREHFLTVRIREVQ